MRRPTRRQWLLIAGAALGGLVVLVLCVTVIFYPRLGAWAIRDKAIPRAERALDREIDVDDIDVSRGKAVLRGVVVRGERDAADAPLARIETVTVHFDYWASLRGSIEVSLVEIDGVHARGVRYADGGDNFRDILDRLGLGDDGGDDDGEKASSGLGGLTPDRLTVTRGSFALRDAAAGLITEADRVTVVAERGGEARLDIAGLSAMTSFGPRAHVEELSVATATDAPADDPVVHVSGGEVRAWTGMSLTGIEGSVARGEGNSRFVLDLAGGYGGAPGQLWTAAGWIDPVSGDAEVSVAADRFTFDRIGMVLEGSPVIDYEDTSIDVDVDLVADDGVVAIDGDLELSGLTVSHPMLAEKPVRDVSLRGTIDGSFDRKSRTLVVDELDVTARGVRYVFDGFYQMPRGVDPETGERREAARVDAHLVIPTLPCQTMLDGIPDALVPYLDGYVLRGKFDTDMRVVIDWSDLDATVLEGGPSIWGCRVVREPKENGAERFLEEFEHFVEVEKDQWISFEVGPSNPDFVPLWEVSPYIQLSFMTTEDNSFERHRGFIVREFRTALIKNLKAERFAFGASSITMQLVKNVMLYREKTLARKLQELFLTWYIEQVLDKDRIFEIYVNVIEYGPGIYGIGPAAMEYFGKHPRELDPVEAAFFSSILPDPKRRYRQYCRGELWKSMDNKVKRILGLMHSRERLTEEEYQLALETPLEFDRFGVDEEECLRRVRRAVKNARPTNPMKK